ncbi:hypothetical protein B879_04245 [Cecembia lonarensis LW9]|uniref:Uncharacterized protein n=1 Tax=Cecembia lonarensis (strain CCUG 58316 / KCTC 22772 / LW9) TaxID=1225176 RepID=K1L548_CECL9|nr:hypothetical protein B879_04245 [Cecembia lonarensis LW9]
MKTPPDDDLPVRLDSGGINLTVRPCSGIKSSIEAAIWIQAGDAVSRNPIVFREKSPDDELPVRLDSGGLNSIVRPRAGSKGSIEAAVRIQAGDAVSPYFVVLCEISSDDDLPVRLDSDGPNANVRPCAGIKICIEAAVRIQPGDPVSPHAVVRIEISPDDELPVRLDSGGTVLFAPVPGLKSVSRLPSGLSRAMRFIATPLYWLNPPPMMIFPSAWIAVV